MSLSFLLGAGVSGEGVASGVGAGSSLTGAGASKSIGS